MPREEAQGCPGRRPREAQKAQEAQEKEEEREGCVTAPEKGALQRPKSCKPGARHPPQGFNINVQEAWSSRCGEAPPCYHIKAVD